MTHQVLSNCLRPILKAEFQWRNRRFNYFTLFGGALGMLILSVLAKFFEWWSTPLSLAIFLGSLVVLVVGRIRLSRQAPDLKELARKVEEEHPDLNAVLLTAMDMEPGPNGRLGFLQSQVLGQVTEHAIRNRWVRQVSAKKLSHAGWLQFASIAVFFVATWLLMGQIPKATGGADQIVANKIDPQPGLERSIEISVKPGDVEVEKGSRVIIEATFQGRVPPGALVVLIDPDDDTERGRIPMKAGIDDSVFSAVAAKVDSKTRYEIRFEESKSDTYTIDTYEHPRLEQADATITPPAYAEKEPRTVEDTRKISLLEGSEVAWSIKVNKPVTFGELFGEDDSVVELKPDPNDPTVLMASHVPDETLKYRLHLVDAKERPNKRPPWFTVTVKKNLPPKLEFAFPKRDVNVSAVEELNVEAKVWDDLGIKGAGIVFAHQDKNREILLTDEELSGEKKHDLATMLAVEELGAKPRELITYYMWAEDLDKHGKVRRTQSDMFLAEVRHFEDIFREQEPGGGGQSPPGGQGQSEKLLKLQKEILNASWNVLRQAHLGKSFGDLSDDIDVIRESQGIAIQKTDEALGEVEDAELKSFFIEAKGHMEKAVEHFTIKVDPFSDPQLKTAPVEPLEMAHASVRSAYESLIKARSREHNVMQQQQQSSQGQPQEKEQQLMNLELKQKDLKYKENSSAQNEQQSAQQQENLEVLNKLKELARRQEAIAKKIKELQNELEEAKTREEKEQIERQLKRLQEEQEELLRELDDLSERMDSEENRADMAEERKKLEETRENVKDAAKDLEENKLADAANSATRAQRDLEEVEDEFRKKTSHQFSEELKGIRQATRDLAEKQQEISKKLDDKAPENTNSNNMFRTPKENQELARDIEEQRETLEKLVEEIKQVSEDAEESEPLLSDALYQAVRETTVNGVEESLAEAGRMVRYNHRNAAREPEQNAAQGIDDLKEKVEKAAEKILGSEADSLRLARAELDRLIEQSQAEANRMEGKEPGREPGEANSPENPQDRPGNGERPGEKGEQGEGKGEQESPKGAGQGKGEQESPKGEGEGKGKGDPKGQGKGGEKGEQPKGGEKGKGKAPGKGEGKGEKGKGEGKGDQPGKGKGKGEGQGKSTQLAKSDQPGKGKGKGKGEGKGEGKGKGSEESTDGKGKGKGQGKGDSQNMAGGEPGKGKGQNLERRPRGKSLLSSGQSGRRAAGSNFGGDDRGSQMPTGLATQPPLFFDQAREQENEPAGPITGEEYKDFANSLGSIEEMMNEEDLRNDVAKVLDNARGMRIDYKRDNLPPGAAEIRQKIVDPLVELRSRVSEELAKINRENPLAPIDRDPVPGEFRELVRRYYEELGAGR